MVLADYDIPADLRYTEDDEWVRLEKGRATVGVTDYAQQQLGDIVFVELPSVGASVEKGEPFGVIESVKAVTDLLAPLSGEVVEMNQDLSERPEAVNEGCYGDGWMIVIDSADPSEHSSLLDAAAYTRHVDGREE